jgi:cyclopropane-fatty-acyl-phospholipid synthase
MAGCTFELRGPDTLRRVLLPPSELSFAEAYVHDDFDIVGNMETAVAEAERVGRRMLSPKRVARLALLALRLPTTHEGGEGDPSRGSSHLAGTPHSPKRDAAAIRYHYDVGNDFYRLWLDRQLVYSCAYFKDETDDIDTAQEAKLDYICRKLRLREGESLLDIGCGWGSLMLHAAQHYGVQAHGITLSHEQAALARERFAAARLADRCHVEVCDYRDLPANAQFDKVSSVGMIEHVGHSRLADYFGSVWRCLRPGGVFFNSGIVIHEATAYLAPGWWGRTFWHEGEFIQHYVFPDGELLPFAEVVKEAETAGFETRDVESLREHYMLTLRRWLSRLEARHEEAAALVGEETYRVWRLYLAGSAHGFASGAIGLMQSVFGKPDHGQSGLPLTRSDLYR